MKPIKQIHWILICALVLGLLFDLLFWEKPLGISVLIFVLCYLAGLVFITIYLEKQRPPWRALIPIAPILFFSQVLFWRAEPVITFVSLLMVLVFLFILTQTWLGGEWLRYSLIDYVHRSARMVVYGIITPLQVYLLGEHHQKTTLIEPDSTHTIESQAARNWVWSVILGLLLAFPVVIILAMLLSNADPFFHKWLNNFFIWTSIQEYITQAVIILFISYLILGGILFSLLHSKDEKLIGLVKPLFPPFLNWVSSVIVLTSVNLLFSAFVIIQFQYFFGGQTNISVEGFTYSEYARRGFSELVIVVFLSLLIFLGLGIFTRRTTGISRHIYSGLGIVLVLMVGVMLVSAFNRLYLYESAYGFSRIRAYTYEFMIWLGILLLAIVILELTNKLRWFALATLMVATFFSINLSLLNVDGLIVRENVANTLQGKKLDSNYLLTLSDDSIPDLFDLYHNPNLSADTHSSLGWVLICHQKMDQRHQSEDNWASFHWSRYQARVLYQQNENEINKIPATLESETGIWQVQLNGVNTACIN